MLTRRRTLLGVLLVFGASVALAQDDEHDSGLRQLTRLTVGVGDQFLGQLSPDGKSLVFVSNRNVATEIYRQDVEQGRERLLFDEGADVTWPRISPDGKWLLYISFRERAGGQLCVRELPTVLERRCLDSGDASALQAEWIDNAHIALVARPSIEGDLKLMKVSLSKELSAAPWVERNLTGPAVSPDGRWLVYVPTERSVKQVGPGFAARAATRLEAQRLDVPGATPIKLTLLLPGLSGQPVFSRDGKTLYVVQFFTDSTGDGHIDASDRGVLFRVPFPTGRDDAPEVAAAAIPEQLTSESWSCEYPAPTATSLIATCIRERSLDVYQLPLDGQVPTAWDTARLNAELTMAGSRAERLLLYQQRLQRETRPRARRMVLMRLSQLHLGFEDFEAADFYARRMHEVEKEPGTEGLSEPLRTLIAHRKAMKERERGRMADDFLSAGTARLETLKPEEAPSPASAAMQHIVRSELAEAAGNFAFARQSLDAVPTGDKLPRAVLEAYFEQADALFRALDDRDALVAAGRVLSKSPSFPVDDQLEFARAAVRALYRGRSYAEADAAMAAAQANEPADSEYAFALELGRRVNAIHEERPPKEARDALLALYQQQTRHGRRQALVQDGVDRASSLGADGVLERLATLYIDEAPHGTQEYRRAERLFRRALLGRAYRRLGRQRVDEARADFDEVTKRTGSLEAAVEAMALRIRGGMDPDKAASEITTTAPGKTEPLQRFVKAYAIARKLPKLNGAEHAAAVKRATETLRAAWPVLKSQRAAQALYGAIHHEDFLRGGDRAAAERANRHYLVALELSGNNLRYRAMLQGATGMLQTQVGNYFIALGALEARERLPSVDNGAGLAVTLARAKVLLHVGREADAVKAAEDALKMVHAKERLEKFLPVVLDRAVLCNLAAGKFERALELSDLAWPALEASSNDAAGTRNRFVSRVARAAAALGANQPQRALDELAFIDQALASPTALAALRWPHRSSEQTSRAYKLIAAGLRANAELLLKHPEAAEQSLEQRRVLFTAQFLESESDSDLRALTLAELRLAQNATERNDAHEAAEWLGQALKHADQLAANAKLSVDVSQVDVLLFAAQLDPAARALMPFDLKARLEQAHDAVLKQPRAAWRTQLAWLEVYLALSGPQPPP